MPTAFDVHLASGLRLSAVHQGDEQGPAVLMVPGPTDSWRSYEPVLAHLPSSLHAVALSCRGHGSSDAPPEGYRIEDFAGDVVLTLDALRVERAVLVGHSGSSLVVRRVAIDHPERVPGLVLEASPMTLRSDPRFGEFVTSVVDELDDPIDTEWIRQFVVGTSSDRVPPELLHVVVEDVARVRAAVWKATFAGLVAYDDRAELARIRAETVLVWGDADPLVAREVQDQLARSIPAAQLVVYEGAGHTPRWEEPARFAADIARVAHASRGRDTPRLT